MTKGNLAGIIVTVVIILFLVGFLASKIQIYDGTTITGIPTSKSAFDSFASLFLPDWLKTIFGL